MGVLRGSILAIGAEVGMRHKPFWVGAKSIVNIYQNNEVDFKLVQLINLHKNKKIAIGKVFFGFK